MYPINPARGLGKRCKLRQRVWDRATAEIDFGAFSLKIDENLYSTHELKRYFNKINK